MEYLTEDLWDSVSNWLSLFNGGVLVRKWFLMMSAVVSAFQMKNRNIDVFYSGETGSRSGI